jgi:isopentenyl diphosphate isomerase/L-lactate dehydrogenase-like FMN-dependent dehydrogenase
VPVLNVTDYEAIARSKMEPTAFDYYAGGSGDERTLADNLAAFDRYVFTPRVLVNAETVDLSQTIAGTSITFPIMLAPTAFNRLAHDDGEVAAARAAGAMGTAMVCSTISTMPLEDVAQAATGPLWFQLYVYRDREVTKDLVRRAEAAGFRALVLTVDTPRLGRRERDIRNRFSLPPGLSIANLERYATAGATRWGGASSFQEYVHKLLDGSLTWESVEWLRSITKLPIFIKGVLAPDDARLAAKAGATGVIVSNHGGRQLDGAIATVDALGPVVDAAGGMPVILDGGVRRGTHVLKALALGAQAVLIGRPYLWALAADGEHGVKTALEMLRSELELAMALAGCQRLADVTGALIHSRPTRLPATEAR